MGWPVLNGVPESHDFRESSITEVGRCESGQPLFRFIKPAGPLPQGMLSLGGFFMGGRFDRRSEKAEGRPVGRSSDLGSRSTLAPAIFDARPTCRKTLGGLFHARNVRQASASITCPHGRRDAIAAGCRAAESSACARGGVRKVQATILAVLALARVVRGGVCLDDMETLDHG